VRSLPIKWRVSLLVTAVLVAVITAASWVAYHELNESLLRDINRSLNVMAGGVLNELADAEAEPTRGQGGDLASEVQAVVGWTKHRRATCFRIWLDGNSSDVLSSDPPPSPRGRPLRDLPAAPASGKPLFFGGDVAGSPYRLVWRRQQVGPSVANVVVGLPSHYLYHEMHEFLRVLLVLGGCMVAGSAVVAALMVFAAMRPLGKAARRLDRITPANLTADKLDDLDPPAELTPFLAALRTLLARLDRFLQQQKQFTADASHELRTPLAVAKSTLQAARARPRAPGEYAEAIDETIRDLDRMERLIAQILALARMDESQQPPPPQKVALHDLLGSLARTFDARAAAGGGRVVADNLPATFVPGDADELEQLFGNLLDNALVHGPAGGTVRVELAHEAAGTCAVSVHDEGGGIPPEAIARLFDRFYRADPSRTRATGGAGLGLAIARQIARRHGGDIAITSRPADGTRATVRLPCAECPGGTGE